MFTSLITCCHFDAAETQARFPYNLPDRVESSQAVVRGSTRRSCGNICEAKRVDRDDCNDFFEMTSRTISNCCNLNLCFVTRKSKNFRCEGPFHLISKAPPTTTTTPTENHIYRLRWGGGGHWQSFFRGVTALAPLIFEIFLRNTGLCQYF